MKSLGFATTSSYFARGSGYEREMGATNFVGNSFLLTKHVVDAIN
jgi:hypothetical protein